LHPRLVQFGHIAIPTYGVVVALALIVALAAATRTARSLALDPDKIWNLSLIGICTTILGSRLLLILFYPRDFIAHPFWMLGLISIRSRGLFYGALLLAICACFGYIFANGLPLRRTLDCLAPAAALGLTLESIGAFAAGSDYGSPTNELWGVVHKHGLANLWSGTPLGVALHPVQLYEALILLLILALLLFLLPRSKHDGDLAGTLLFFHGLSEYFLDFYRGNRSFVVHEAITVTQAAAIILVLAGAAIWVGDVPRLEETEHNEREGQQFEN
jgi:phosphatidylglycerol:prolipoprotein diacylglycerol transferase